MQCCENQTGLARCEPASLAESDDSNGFENPVRVEQILIVAYLIRVSR